MENVFFTPVSPSTYVGIAAPPAPGPAPLLDPVAQALIQPSALGRREMHVNVRRGTSPVSEVILNLPSFETAIREMRPAGMLESVHMRLFRRDLRQLAIFLHDLIEPPARNRVSLARREQRTRSRSAFVPKISPQTTQFFFVQSVFPRNRTFPARHIKDSVPVSIIRHL